ncbi:hypothetical protein ABGV42_00085 [Paenibacillus pabuli]|uniref:hypothetical protein n=1 Tax=Paenibacillus pabuli TaxID=1472 RepID=UPI0032420285
MHNRIKEYLRNFETPCYSICIHLIKNEPKAVMAAEKTLIDFYKYLLDNFTDEDNHSKVLKQMAIKHSLPLINS